MDSHVCWLQESCPVFSLRIKEAKGNVGSEPDICSNGPYLLPSVLCTHQSLDVAAVWLWLCVSMGRNQCLQLLSELLLPIMIICKVGQIIHMYIHICPCSIHHSIINWLCNDKVSCTCFIIIAIPNVITASPPREKSNILPSHLQSPPCGLTQCFDISASNVNCNDMHHMNNGLCYCSLYPVYSLSFVLRASETNCV